MSNYSVLKQDINNNIYENQTQQITGTVLNAILNEMTASLGAGYQFAGVATLGMNPGDPDQRVFYLAGEGIYTSFGGIQVPAGKLGVLKWDNRWTLQTIDGLGGGGANLTGYVSVASTDDLPDEGQPTLGYLCGENLYLYVGEGGDTKEGKYQNCGSFRGPQGDSVQDVEQTQTSLENGGVNKIKFTLSNGISCEFQVRNGTTSSGLFPTVAALQAAYPNPVVGQYAFVGVGFPADIYVCTTAGTWTDSGEDYDGDNVDLTDYATKAEVNQLEAEVTDLQDGETVLQQQIDAIHPVVIEGNVTNAPDNEDITATPDNRLKFADRPATLTNKGYKILRKDATFASQVTDTNTIYEIRYDFDLGGNEFAMPSGCFLRFVGGSISNGTITTNPFRVVADNDVSILKGISFDGSYITNDTIFVDWFDFVTDGVTDNFNAFKRLENLINTKGGGNIVFGLAKTYAVKTILTYLTNIYVASENSGLFFDSCANLDIDLNGSTMKLLPSNTPWSMVFTIVNCEYAKIHNGKIVGDRLGHDYTAYINYAGETSTSFEWNYGVRQCGGFLELADLDISQCVGDGVQVGGNSAGSGRNYSGRYYIHDCEISFCGRNGITCHSSFDTNTIERTFIHDIAMDNIPSFSPKSAIDIEFEDGMHDVPFLVFDSLIVDNCYTGITSSNGSAVQGFVLKNSIIRKANLVLINMAIASPVYSCIVQSCSIEMTDDFNGSEIHNIGKTVFRDCNFVGLRGIVTSPELYDGCSISTTSDSTKLAVTGNAFPFGSGTVFPDTNNCVFEVKAGFIQITNSDKIKNTFFHFGENVSDVRFASVTFTGCRFKTEIAVNKNTTNSGTGDVVYKNCVIEWIGATQKVINDYNAAQITIFDGCLLKGTLIQSYGGRVKASNCLFNDCEITKVNKAGVGKDIYSSCSFYECKGTNTGAIDFNDCILISETARDKKDVLGIGNYYDFWGNYVFNGCTIYARNFTNNTRATYCTYHNCTLDIDSAYLTGAKIYNGVVKSTTANRATEFVNSVYLLNGVETPAKSGTTADRPTASAVGAGFTYFDTDLGKMIVSNGTAWVNMDGSALS